MHFNNGSLSAKRNKVMTPEQFKQVVEAITDGRYSWACVLILRFAGYNPVHFIPYRTYCRLVKENRILSTAIAPEQEAQPCPKTTMTAHLANRPKPSTQIKELAYLEDMDSGKSNPQGGKLLSWFDQRIRQHFSIKLGLLKR